MIILVQLLNGVPQWPDSTDKFIHPGEINEDGLVIEYTGELNLDEYTQILEIPVTITDVVDEISGDFSNFIVKELTPFTVIADVPLGVDQDFIMPILREDTGRVVYVIASIINNVLTLTASLPTSGKWVCGENQINSNLGDVPFKFTFSGLTITAVQ